eukprot:964853-Pyramimonas_sp.AAC.1
MLFVGWMLCEQDAALRVHRGATAAHPLAGVRLVPGARPGGRVRVHPVLPQYHVPGGGSRLLRQLARLLPG